ncbi:diguanylate cyclase [Chitinibacteraceae bacterium HSL-7]
MSRIASLYRALSGHALLAAGYVLAAVLDHQLANLSAGHPPALWLASGVGMIALATRGPVALIWLIPLAVACTPLRYTALQRPDHVLLILLLGATAALEHILAARGWMTCSNRSHHTPMRHANELLPFWLQVCALPASLNLILVPLAFKLTGHSALMPPLIPLACASALGILLIAPLLVVWRDRARYPWHSPQRRGIYAALLLPALLLASVTQLHELIILALPVLLAIAVHFAWPGVSVALLAMAITLGAATRMGSGPFMHDHALTPEVSYQVFIASVALTLQYLALAHEFLIRAKTELEAEVLRRTTALTEANERLAELATVDELTGLVNRREWQRRCADAILRSRRTRQPLALVMLDIDHFKNINDQHGHLHGDLALRALARIATQTLRATDVVGRWGGEEFVILLPDTSLETAHQVTEKLRSAIESSELSCSPDSSICFTISAGVTVLHQQDGTLDDIIRRVDDALYRAKRAGRNRTEIDVLPESA